MEPSRLLPPHDLRATDAAGCYPVDTLVPLDIMNLLKPEAVILMKRTKADVAKQRIPRLVVNRIEALRHFKLKHKQTEVQIMLYLGHMVCVRRLKTPLQPAQQPEA